MASKKPGEKNFRDAGTGEFVKKDYAEKHSGTTVSEPRPSPKQPAPKSPSKKGK